MLGIPPHVLNSAAAATADDASRGPHHSSRCPLSSWRASSRTLRILTVVDVLRMIDAVSATTVVRMVFNTVDMRYTFICCCVPLVPPRCEVYIYTRTFAFWE